MSRVHVSEQITSCVRRSEETPKYGAGQGIEWSGQSCSATLNTISNAMNDNCKGIKFQNPTGKITVETFGDYFLTILSTELTKQERKQI